MDSDIIDLIYQNDAVEGLAIFDENNQLVENQLSLTLNKVLAISATLHKLQKGITNAGRELRGFVIKSGSYLLLVCMSPDLLIILELSPGYSVNEVDSNVRSIIGGASPRTQQPAQQPAQPAQPAQPVAQQPAQPAQPVAQQPAQPAASQMIDGIDLNDFKANLSKLLKTVAPGKLADTMISSAMADMGIDENAVQLPQQQATELGYSVIEKIPNKARRNIIKNEYTKLLGQ